MTEDQVKVNPKENLLYRSGNNKILESVFCKKRQKIVPDQLLVWGIRASEGSEWYQTDPR